MDEKELELVKVAITDTFSDFYNQVIKKRFNEIDKKFEEVNEKFEVVNEKFEVVNEKFEVVNERFDQVNHEIRELRLTTEALVKIVDYARLESKVAALENRIKHLEDERN
ncbi:MAG: hypothetical protein OXH57_04250 [Ekhidna sp.]|nr:hypothetical protein [Ekhidna sp.]